MWFRQRPQCSHGSLVQLKSGEYLIIRNTRWARLQGEVHKSWVYDGPVIETHQTNSIRLVTGMSGVLEADIKNVVAI